jgi:DNA-binding transcriptional LysR family regulator
MVGIGRENAFMPSSTTAESCRDLQHLSAFLAVAEAGSISRGAERLHRSQPALSKEIADFEHKLGHRLFDRIPKRGVALTAAGELLARYARQVATLCEEASCALRDMEGLASGSLAIGASSTSGTYVFPSVLGAFRTRYPGIELRLRIGNSEAMLDLLRDRAIDLAFVEGTCVGDEFVCAGFIEDHIRLIAPPEHPATAGTMDPFDLSRHTYVQRERGSGTRQTVEQALAQRGIDLPNVITIDSIEAVKRAVRAGIGLSWISDLAVTDELAAGQLVAVSVRDFAIVRHHRVLHSRWCEPKRAARALIDLLYANPHMRSICHLLPQDGVGGDTGPEGLPIPRR